MAHAPFVASLPKYMAGCAMNPEPLVVLLFGFGAQPERLPCTSRKNFVFAPVQGMNHMQANASSSW